MTKLEFLTFLSTSFEDIESNILHFIFGFPEDFLIGWLLVAIKQLRIEKKT